MRLSILLMCASVSCGAPDAPATPPSNPCSAVEGLGCPCGALSGAWRCAGSQPVCVCSPGVDAGMVADVPVADVPVAVHDAPIDTPPDVTNTTCVEGLYCASVRGCVNLMTTRAHCGACDRACPSGASCVQGVCMRPDAGVRDVPCTADAANDPLNCGACGRVCETRAPHARAVCREGVCVVMCESRAWWDCNNDPLDGCESTDTRRDLCGCVCRDVLGAPTP